jgi:succinoglycan biosynthesis protein ExoU
LSAEIRDFSAAVIIAAKDAEATIARAVRSALADPLAAQVIVVDDGSRDGTSAAARSADDRSGRLEVIRLGENVGPAAARNLAIANSDAPFVAILDSDDYWRPGRLSRMAQQASDSDLIADDLEIVREDQHDAPAQRLIGVGDTPLEIGLADFLLHNISRKGAYRREWGFLKPVMRRSFLAANSLAYDPALRLGEDFMLYAQSLARGARFRVCGPCGYVAVERRASLSANHSSCDLDGLLRAARTLRQEPLTPAGQDALRRYLRHLKVKTRYRQLIDARRSGGLAAVASLLLSDLDALPSALLGRLERVEPPAMARG